MSDKFLIFPGRSCPGLIEARPRRDRQSGDDTHFRGEAAPASLKPDRAARGRHRKHRDFRGEAAPASLKLAAGRSFATRRTVFPGRSCPGLIEAGIPATGRLRSSLFPGRSCPGLIEAPRTLKDLDVRQIISGAKLPRPH